jgi:hypothetical protein
MYPTKNRTRVLRKLNKVVVLIDSNRFITKKPTQILFHSKKCSTTSGTDDRMKVENNFNLESSKSEKIVQTSLLAQNLQYVSLKS